MTTDDAHHHHHESSFEDLRIRSKKLQDRSHLLLSKQQGTDLINPYSHLLYLGCRLLITMRPGNRLHAFAVLCLLLESSQTTTALQIGPLLSTCVEACRAGCAEIRAVQAKRTTGDVEFEFKVEGDNRSALTEADTAAQRAIVGALRQTWGGQLRIIAEEDDDDEQLKEMIDQKAFPKLRKDLFEDDIGETAELDLSEVTIYVDPLDGTREVGPHSNSTY